VSKGILSGTKSRGFVSLGCGDRVALAALAVLSFDIRPPSTATAVFVVIQITKDVLFLATPVVTQKIVR
jgi:tetrahydromethanopterin S-methyltransferase subunit C